MPDPESNNIRRLGEAFALLQQYRDSDQQSDEGFLAAHADLADLLEPLLRGEDAATVLGETLRAEPIPSEHGIARKLPGEIDKYRVISELGFGGMGVVYLAEQTAPVRRLVALKLIKATLASNQALARFDAEKQALALMSHPNVATVFDAGETDDGSPFFAMEYIQGEPITTYCDQNGLDIGARLSLFRQVCDGVHHAHQKGIIHRDLKPSNVLVCERDGKPTPVIIDFGIAKALGGELTDRTIQESTGHIVGTLEHMSPEQITGRIEDIDTRTDVHALGLLLYELLTGVHAFQRMDSATPQEVERIINDHVPTKPSIRLKDLEEGLLHRIATGRSGTATTLNRQLGGDLDWIVLKTLEKERARRYQTVLAISDDIERHLHFEPVSAHAPSKVYVFKRFLRRRRGLVTASAAVLAALGVGLGAALFEGAQARRHLERFDRLAVIVRLQEARDLQDDLHPPWPENIDALEGWLGEWGLPLAADLPLVSQTIRDLETTTSARDPELAEELRASHPQYQELVDQQRLVDNLSKAMRVRLAATPLSPVALPLGTESDAIALNDLAWERVNPDRSPKNYGEEALGLAYARKAITLADPTQEHVLRDTLAWALFANGLDDDARDASWAARDAAPEADKREYHEYLLRLERAIDAAEDTLTAAESRLEALTATTLPLRFEDRKDEFLHQSLSDLAIDLGRFTGESGILRDVQHRWTWAKSVEALTEHHPSIPATWEDARRAIAAADGIVASALYAADPIDLQPQMGLVPIGMNPATKLWEFYHLRSAWTPSPDNDPFAIPVPVHSPDGTISIGPESGIVFVLIPGGSFEMGAQSEDADAPNFDPGAMGHEQPLHRVTLSPFFLARHEMTQGQWNRLSRDGNPSRHAPGFLAFGMEQAVDGSHPVEQVNWFECTNLLEHYGLVLPTEAQWEYACRAGTTDTWFSGPNAEDLREYANISWPGGSTTPVPGWTTGENPPFANGSVIHAPVGRLRMNGFGMHDMIGNLFEWCRDRQGLFVFPVTPGDAERIIDATVSVSRVIRGGSSFQEAADARTAFRVGFDPQVRQSILGVRASRVLRD